MTNKRLIRAVILPSVALTVLGCVNQPKTAEVLPPANGKGAVVIPINLDGVPEGKSYACRSISFEVKKTFWNPSEPRDAHRWEVFLSSRPSMALVTDLLPGDYQVSEYRCYAHNRYVLDGAKSYISYRTSFSFEIKEDTVTLSDRGFVGKETFDKAGSSTFWANFRATTEDGVKRAKSELIARGIPEGWTVAF